MTPWPHRPFMYEINTWVWLHTLSQRTGQRLTLATVPDEALDALVALHIDAVWLMGIWQRSAAARSSALNYLHEYQHALPDITPEDVIGSAYAVGGYAVDWRLGGREGLAHLRKRFAERGLKLILDFVPNHVAVDHPWVAHKPTCFVRANEREFKRHRGMFFATRDAWGRSLYVAHGRDPYFPPWIDTAQLNAFSADYRAAALEALLDIATQCDGVRCDMAMLLLNSVFANTWGSYVDEELPAVDFWMEIIPEIKARHRHFLFMAEVYWGLEGTLLRQGFDYVYDKTLYDRVTQQDAAGIEDHLRAPLDYQEHAVRFIENHDEPRIASILSPERNMNAAALVYTLPGAVLIHDGQLAGRKIRLPVQIRRQPEEPALHKLEAFYMKLLSETQDSVYRNGSWQRFDVQPPRADSEEHLPLLAHGWREGNDRYRLTIANLSASWAKGLINLSAWPTVGVDNWCLRDVLSGAQYYRSGEQMTGEGLFVELAPHQAQILDFVRVPVGQPAPCQP